MERAYIVSTKILLALLFGFVVFQAAVRPLTISEATLWDHLVRPNFRDAFVAPDAWSGLLYAIAAKRAVGLFRLSEFTLRLPAVVACAAYLLILATRARPAVALLLAVPPVALGWFSTATPQSLALAFTLAGVGPWRISERRRAGYCGLALAASLVFAVPLAILTVWQICRHGIPILERVAIPALAAAFLFLIVPLSHAAPGPRPGIGGREESEVRTGLRTLRNRGTLRIAVERPLLPLVAFYRARYRQRDWVITDVQPQYRIGLAGSLEP